METETTPCLICKSSDFEPYYQLRDWACEVPGEFQLINCRNCGHIYQSPRPSQAEIGAFYPDDYQPFRRAIAKERSLAMRALRHLQLRTRCLQVARLRDGGRLLDVGASTGLFLNEMRRYGDWQLAGVELNEHAASYARETFGLEMSVGQLEDAPWPSDFFDVITLWDVLEHLPNPRSALSKIHELLAEHGLLILSVPNADSVDAWLFGRYWIGLDAPRHMSVFSVATLRRLLEETGFKIEEAYCFYGRYTTFALSLQQWLRAHRRRTASRRLVERVLFLPIWRFLSLPYFWVVDQLKRGAIITVRARPRRMK